VLQEVEADYWAPVEPEIIVALYPDTCFPFPPFLSGVMCQSDEPEASREAAEESKAEKVRLPDQTYVLIVFVSTYNFRDADAVYAPGLSYR